ncbi:hypothetical protein [Nocardia wallacei]|uniref:hypothetical protein n=1 Tax=Nocardia wallacei TaxID=480035 RepID=UPI002454C527|nr:hypothetical protein [Nocardia wallacei]
MPDKLHSVPESFTLGLRDETVVALVASADEAALAEWMQALLAAKQAVSGKIVPAAFGERVVAVIHTHPSFLPVIAATSSAAGISDFVALPQADLS